MPQRRESLETPRILSRVRIAALAANLRPSLRVDVAIVSPPNLTYPPPTAGLHEGIRRNRAVSNIVENVPVSLVAIAHAVLHRRECAEEVSIQACDPLAAPSAQWWVRFDNYFNRLLAALYRIALLQNGRVHAPPWTGRVPTHKSRSWNDATGEGPPRTRAHARTGNLRRPSPAPHRVGLTRCEEAAGFREVLAEPASGIITWSTRRVK